MPWHPSIRAARPAHAVRWHTYRGVIAAGIVIWSGWILATTTHAESQTLTRKEVTDIVAANRKIVSEHGVEESMPLQIRGTTQWVSVRGRDRGNPLLLYLHGGPGSPTWPEAYTFQGPWEDYFTVVQWDQRGTGKTYAANDAAKLADTINLGEMTDDTLELIRQLRERYHKQRIFLLGHSWGSALGVQVALRRPEWLYAYIGVGQMANTLKSEADGFQFALQQAHAHGNDKAVHELEAIAPYPGTQPLTVERVTAQRKWVMYYGGLAWNRQDFSWDADNWLLSPDYSDQELDAIGLGSRYSLQRLVKDFVAVDLFETREFRCPIFVFNGRHDYTVSQQVSEQWFKTLRAPRKQLVWFENSAHLMMQEEPGRFLLHLVMDVRPLAAKSPDVPETLTP